MSPASESPVVLAPEQWIARYGDALYGYAVARLRDADNAAELVQDTLVTALEKRHTFGGRSTEKTWLFAILKNKLVDMVRLQAKNTHLGDTEDDCTFFHDTTLGSHWRKDQYPQAWPAAAEAEVPDEQVYAQLQHCLDALPPTWARLMTLKTIDELPTASICKELNISPSNLWVMMHRARLQLRACIETVWA